MLATTSASVRQRTVCSAKQRPGNYRSPPPQNDAMNRNVPTANDQPLGKTSQQTKPQQQRERATRTRETYMVKHPGHFTSMKNELGDCTSRFNLCFLASTAGSGCSRSHSRAYAVHTRKQYDRRDTKRAHRETSGAGKHKKHSGRRCSKTDLGQHHRSRAAAPRMGRLQPPSGREPARQTARGGATRRTPTPPEAAAAPSRQSKRTGMMKKSC